MRSVSDAMSPAGHPLRNCPSLNVSINRDDLQQVTQAYSAAKRCQCPRCKILTSGLFPLVYGSPRRVSEDPRLQTLGPTTTPRPVGWFSPSNLERLLSSGRPVP